MRLSRYNDYDMNPQHTEVVLTNLVFIILQGLIAVTSFVCYCSYVFIARQHSDAQFCLSVCMDRLLFPITLSAPNPCFQGYTTFDAKYLKNGYRYGHSYYRRPIGNRT